MCARNACDAQGRAQSGKGYVSLDLPWGGQRNYSSGTGKKHSHRQVGNLRPREGRDFLEVTQQKNNPGFCANVLC